MQSKTLRIALIIGIPILFALLARWLFGFKSYFWLELFNIMGIAFLFFLPFGIGALTIYLSKPEKVQKLAYRFFMPWVPVAGFFLITLLFSIEGWACWIMIMPVFLSASSIGGLIAGHYKLKKGKHEKLYVSLAVLLPFFLSPIEQAIGSISGQYKADTHIDIRASSRKKIWANVTRVRAITKQEDKGWLTPRLGFPRPIKAELNYNGWVVSEEPFLIRDSCLMKPCSPMRINEK